MWHLWWNGGFIIFVKSKFTLFKPKHTDILIADKRSGEEAVKLFFHQYNYEYYVLNKPSISDKEFDKTFDKLVAIENKHPELKTIDSPTQKVGSDLNQNLPEANHSISVLSLDKAYTIETLEQWIQKKETNTNQKLVFSIEQKIDGSSIIVLLSSG